MSSIVELGMVKSAGFEGDDLECSDNRVKRIKSGQASWRDAVELRKLALQHGKTRAQLKYEGQLDKVPDSAKHLVNAFFRPTVASSEYPTQSGVIFMSANAEGRRDPTLQAKWDIARPIWSKPLHITPRERLDRLRKQGYTSDTTLTKKDEDQLSQVWGPLGWLLSGVRQFRRVYDPRDPSKAGYFACIRDRRGTIVSAAKAEEVKIGGLILIESTEWGTDEEVQGQGCATGAVAALNSAMYEQWLASQKATVTINNGLSSQPREDGVTLINLGIPQSNSEPQEAVVTFNSGILQLPPSPPIVIMAEANLDPNSPGHRVARSAGFTPAGADMSSPMPNCVLEAHVSIYGNLASFLPVQITPEDWAKYYSS